jgi:transcriptional regulator with XRE-family HTH domain
MVQRMPLDDQNGDAHDDPVGFGGAVKNELKNQGQNQEWLARGLDVDRATISRLLAGHRSATLDEVEAIARALGITTGDLLRSAGYVDDVTDTEAVINADPRLTAANRAVLIAAYRAAVERRR